MCSVMAPGQSGFINPKGEADTHHSDQLEMYAAFKCKSDAISAQDIDKSSQGSQTLRY
jgi:penicillin amidase